ncbi:NCS1 family nucleobase:cation symporter-1 [Nocardiopsis sp. RSe5-2]|uniref:NCS1 family nucleobase:cation symporter-1 n=1 Tax=Nocardiopsis endophytica TaxID=3018445 RepID=A0ABT4UAW5_9ACTN|nr:NCS1 family nucleobase:cation symporter-1 [Nocardiopsis endophytica]MDA2814112.1 NCS1 family nucleobase:cation symporter-1 [Nocardiopsis endophytica]
MTDPTTTAPSAATEPAAAAHPAVPDGADPALYNDDIAPLPEKKRTWGWFEIFNVWSNDIQSLFGYTLAATLFVSYGLNGWAVFGGIMLAGVIIMFLCNLVGRPSVRHGIPYAVVARASLGVYGTQFPTMLRAITAVFWYGAQTYFASTAVALMITALFGPGPDAAFLGMSAVGWLSYAIVALFQLGLFVRGMQWIGTFLNWAGPAVYVVMIALMGVIWWRAGGGLLSEIGTVFSGSGAQATEANGGVSAFFAVVGTMVAYFAAVVVNYGDFSRFVRSERSMKVGNLLGLPVSLAVFSFLALVITAGTGVLYGEALTNPSDIVEQVDNTALTVVAALTFFVATVGINLVANFIPPVYALANLAPRKINAFTGGLITAAVGFVIGGLWVAFIEGIGIAAFVDTLGAVLAPLFGIIVADYYLIRRQRLDVKALYSSSPDGPYHYTRGWNLRAMAVFAAASVFSIAAVWLPALEFLSGFAWILGAALGAVLHWAIMRGKVREAVSAE